MFRAATAVLILAVALAGPSAGAEKNTPKLTKEARDGAQVTQENIIRLKLKRVQQPGQFNPPMPVGGPPPALPPSPPNP